MTSSLDWAGLIPAVTATAQAAAVMVQVYWGQRQRGTRTTKHHECCSGPHHTKSSPPDTRTARVEVSLTAPASTSVTLVFLANGGANSPSPYSLPAKDYRPW